MSRSNIKELIEDFKSYEALDHRLFEVVGTTIQYEIGFKKYLNEFKIKDNRMNFGATTGIDMYKGKNGLIVGTPHMDEKVCKLIACYLGVDVTNSVLAPRRITRKGFSFCLMTYKDAILRNIQLYFIDSELEQAVGRSRLLREDCTVFLFSNYPCEQAEIVEEDYLKQEESDMPDEDIPDSQ